jgi:NAD(P)H-hydrate epimerase
VTDGKKNPLSQAMLAVQKLGIQTATWDTEKASALCSAADFIIDGITGTGLNSPLHGIPLEMAETLNSIKQKNGKPLVVSIDIPSGNFDGWQSGMPIITADTTLAVEPQKLCLYTPAARPYAGNILPVGSVFTPALINTYQEARIITWEQSSALIPEIPKTAHKYERGVIEIRAGSEGAAGAAHLSALGAQAAGAGLVRLIVDPSVYSVLAGNCTGIMVTTESTSVEAGRFKPDAVLLGPGWGKSEDRIRLLESCLPLEKQGVPLILDADAIALAKDMVFHGNAILTPHVGEFAVYTGLPKEEILNRPFPLLRSFAEKSQAVILLKSHVMYAASPDGRIGIIDGMNPLLAAGGSGDVLAGLCAAIAGRWRALSSRTDGSTDGYLCACAAASLLIHAAGSKALTNRFADPAEIVDAAAAIAAAASASSAGSANLFVNALLPAAWISKEAAAQAHK